MQDHESDNKIQFNLSISTDRDKFLRRTCPACGRDFKTQVNEADLAWAVAPQFRRMGLEVGMADVQGAEESSEPHLHCPYCSYNTKASETLTDETMNYLKRFVMREYILPMTNNLFSGLDDIGSRSGGFLSIKIEHSRSIFPPRPVHGPEPPDMKIVEYLCCGKKAKVSDGWNLIDHCVFCGTSVNLQ